MSRDEGFAVADVSSSLLDDPKVKRLWRERLRPDAAAMDAAVVVHQATLLASWKLGERVPAEDAAPIWSEDVAVAIESLVAVGLLDRSHKIPVKSWRNWFGVAKARRDETREKWRLRKQGQRSRSTVADGVPEDAAESRVLPTVPSVRSSPTVPSVRSSLLDAGVKPELVK